MTGRDLTGMELHIDSGLISALGNRNRFSGNLNRNQTAPDG